MIHIAQISYCSNMKGINSCVKTYVCFLSLLKIFTVVQSIICLSGINNEILNRPIITKIKHTCGRVVLIAVMQC